MAAEERLYRTDEEGMALGEEEWCSAQEVNDELSAAFMSAELAAVQGGSPPMAGPGCSARVEASVRGSPAGRRRVANLVMCLKSTSPSLDTSTCLERTIRNKFGFDFFFTFDHFRQKLTSIPSKCCQKLIILSFPPLDGPASGTDFFCNPFGEIFPQEPSKVRCTFVD